MVAAAAEKPGVAGPHGGSAPSGHGGAADDEDGEGLAISSG